MPPQAGNGRARLIGVDVARGLALFGMMATHVFDTFAYDGTPTVATVLASGRSAATFALLAGVGLAFLSGGRSAVRGRERVAASAAVAARALLIGLIGLLLGFTRSDLDVILAFYALMFLLAIPMLGLRPWVLAAVCIALIALGPTLLLITARTEASGPGGEPTLVTLVTDPVGLLVLLLLTGYYPVVVYLAYICAGLGIGRLDLGSSGCAWFLLGGGLGLAVMAQVASWVLLHPLGGLARLLSDPGLPGDPTYAEVALLWAPEQGTSWWYLALASPHAHTPLDLVHALGSAMAVLGASLLLTRMAAVERLLRPLALVGAMTLTLYSAHILVLATGLFGDSETATYALLVGASFLFAAGWRKQGPLERMVAVTSGRARRAVLGASAGAPSGATCAPSARLHLAIPRWRRATPRCPSPGRRTWWR